MTTFWATQGEFGPLFVPTSGHTEKYSISSIDLRNHINVYFIGASIKLILNYDAYSLAVFGKGDIKIP